MTKYTNNEQYEKDKVLLIEKLEKDLDNIYSLDPLDVADVLNLLKQSKWIGNDDNDSIRNTFKENVFDAIFNAVCNHGVVPDKSVVQIYTNIACDDFFEEMQRD